MRLWIKGRELVTMAAAGLLALTSSVAEAGIWADMSQRAARNGDMPRALSNQVPVMAAARLVRLDADALMFQLGQAPEASAIATAPILSLPLPHGGLADYRVVNAPVMAPGLQREFPDIRTYKVRSVDHPERTGRLDVGPSGFHGMFDDGTDLVFVDPVGTDGAYQVFHKSEYRNPAMRASTSFSCALHDHGDSPVTHRARQTSARVFSFGTQRRVYRVAVAATGEYTTFHGGTRSQGQAAIVTAMNRVNELYERDLGISLELVANNSAVVYTNPETDPYTDDDTEALINEVGPDLNNRIGSTNFDVGHVFSTGGGGLAGLGVACSPFKAEGVSGIPQPINDPFVVDFVAHEFGHQFNAEHTFNGTAGSCGANRAGTSAWEPGSGSTVMGYAGICGEENLQQRTDDYFHVGSISSINAFINNSSRGGRCGTVQTLANAIPSASAGTDGFIPAGTPFVLSGSGSDADGSGSLTYAWEQLDAGAATSSQADFLDDGTRALFRSFPPTSDPARSIPRNVDAVAAGGYTGEILPTTGRDLNFRLTVRDGDGGVATDDRVVSVVTSAGPFEVTAPGAVTWPAGSSQTVRWDVANTTAAPLSCATVRISLSTDGGLTFGNPIATTPNDGSENIVLPTVNTTRARIKVQCATQPFFNVNPVNFVIGTGVGGSANTDPVAQNDAVTLNQNSGVINLSVLANDSDADQGDTLTITSVSVPDQGGTASVAGAAIAYESANGFSGVETFSYTISDGNGGSASATVTVTVNAAVPPAPPTPPPAPTPTPTPVPPPASGGGGGGGAIALLLPCLGALALRRRRARVTVTT